MLGHSLSAHVTVTHKLSDMCTRVRKSQMYIFPPVNIEILGASLFLKGHSANSQRVYTCEPTVLPCWEG